MDIRDLRLALTLCRRELRGGLRGFGVFLGCLFLGVLAISAVGSWGKPWKRAWPATPRPSLAVT